MAHQDWHLAPGTSPDTASEVAKSIQTAAELTNLCFLFGAGASFHLAGPKIRDQTIDQILALGLAPGETPHPTLRSVLERLITGTADVEDILEKIEITLAFATKLSPTHIWLGNSEVSQADLHGASDALRNGLANSCANVHDAVSSAGGTASSHAELFSACLGVRRTEHAPLSIFTTNYDRVIEASLDRIGLPFNDGMVGSIRQVLDIESFDTELHRRQRYSVPLRRDYARLYKLHGCVTWCFRPDGMVERTAVAAERAVIYPVQSKEAVSLGFPYSDLLRKLRESLELRDTCLIVVGYGFRDAHVNRIIYSAARSNLGLKVFVVDPFGSAGPTGALSTHLQPLAAIAGERLGVISGPLATIENAAQIFRGTLQIPAQDLPVAAESAQTALSGPAAE